LNEVCAWFREVFEVSRQKVVVLGSNFGGLTAALAVKLELKGDVDVTVVSPSPQFLFNPSLIWLPFGKRSPDDITFPLAPTFEQHSVDFVHAEATRPISRTSESRRRQAPTD
jgi:sulfide:quinone oxidoreductase